MVIIHLVWMFLKLMAYLEVKKRRGNRVEGGRVIQLSCLEVF